MANRRTHACLLTVLFHCAICTVFTLLSVLLHSSRAISQAISLYMVISPAQYSMGYLHGVLLDTYYVTSYDKTDYLLKLFKTHYKLVKSPW